VTLDKVLIYAGLLLLTAAAPYGSLLAFVMLSPWNAVNDLIGWDPRLLWSLMLAIRASFGGWRFKAFRFPPLAIWSFWAFVLLALVGLVCDTERVPSAEVKSAVFLFLYFVAGAFASYAVIKLAHCGKRLKYLAIVSACSIVCASAVGLLQAASSYFTGEATARIPGTLGNPNYFAAYLSVGAAAMILLCRLRILSRAISIPVCIIAIITCFLTLSRMGTVACLLGITLALLIKPEGRLVDLRLLAALGVMGAVGIALAVGYFTQVRESLTFSRDPNQAEVASILQEAEDLSRLKAVQFAWKTWEENPTFGAGINTVAARNLKTTGMYVTTHDTYMQILAGTGAAGFLLILAMIMSLMRNLTRPRRRYMLPLFAVLFVCSFFGDYLQSIEIFVLFSVLFATLLHSRATPPETACLEQY
jgi:O-antigen ligase